MMQLNVTPDFKKRSLKFKPEFPAAAKLESVELVIPNPDGEIKTAGLSFIIYSARCGGRKLAVCDAFTGTGTITGTLNLCTDRMVDEFYHLPLGTRRSFHAVLWSEADQWMIGAGRISIVNNPGSDSLNPAPLPADRYPTFEEVEEMIRNSGGLDEPVVRRVNGIAPDNAGNVSITIPGDVSELKDKDGLTLAVEQKEALATLSTTYAAKNHTHSEYALKSELPDVSGFITADKLNLYQLKADAFSGKYADLAGKPSAFPPASHTHAVADVNGLADELSRKLTVPAGGNAGQFLMKTVSGCGWSSIDLASYITITQARNEFAAKTHEHSQYALASALQDYAAKVHTHIIGDVTGLQDALDGKAAADHNHDSVYAPKEATAAALNAKLTIPAGGTAGQVIGKTSDGYGWITVSGGVSSWNDLTDKPSAFPPATHNHVIGDVTGLENKLSEKISSVNGQVPNSSGAVTLPVATSKADGLMSAADKEKLDGLDTTGSTGDMLKSVYDTDDDGIVDHAAAADAVGATTAAQVADAVGKAHTHANKTTLDKLAETDGKLTFDGAEIGGGSGTVKSVNGQLPDESGNVTVETGGVVDESRLLPTGGKDGDILGYQEGVDRGNGADVRLLLQNALTDSANGNAAPAAVTTQGVTLTGDNNLLFDGNDSHVTAVLATDEIFAADKEWTIDFWMKPTANSSEWNYILTENRGDWGSHSIGLTWNKTKNVLEQDTGGYLASVIRSSNWPNDSVACAASEWHFVAVEKQKTASGWNLNYYLNGAIWLQVAFTADFVPFDASDNPFWFGGKTTDSGRWFKGEVNKLRVTMGARYGGKAFAVPDRLTDYAAPAGQPVWTKGIDRSRLLPDVSSLTQADDGKVMQFKFTSAEAEVPFCCNCQALMPDTTNQLVNDSGTGTTLTLGNTLAVSDVPGPFGGNCVSGIGNDGDSYTISISPRVAFSAADDFTLEWWLRPPTNALNETFLYFCKENGNYDYSWRIYNGAFWQMSSEIIPASEISSLALKANDWNFLVLCRKSGMFRLFINGIRVFSKSWQWAPPESVTFWKFAGGVSGVSNYCGGFRYSRSALYENDFEVPTAPFSVNAGREMVLDFMREATTSKAGAMSAADKAKLDSISTSSVSWYTISDANTITLDRANGELQKVTLTQNCTLTAPVLDADHPTLLLQVTSSSAVTVTVGETNIVTAHIGTFQVGWYWDGETTRRYPVVEVA